MSRFTFFIVLVLMFFSGFSPLQAQVGFFGGIMGQTNYDLNPISDHIAPLGFDGPSDLGIGGGVNVLKEDNRLVSLIGFQFAQSNKSNDEYRVSTTYVTLEMAYGYILYNTPNHKIDIMLGIGYADNTISLVQKNSTPQSTQQLVSGNYNRIDFNTNDLNLFRRLYLAPRVQYRTLLGPFKVCLFTSYNWGFNGSLEWKADDAIVTDFPTHRINKFNFGLLFGY
ncbi:MAG: hypothetical protein JJT94_06755 [Bernardetiaceae bacterium]|nr:hypothetical protein [Bernardetiaceae bacterium]